MTGQARTVAIVTNLRWTKLQIAVLLSLASALGTLALLNYLSEAGYVRCVNETNGLCVRTTFTIPIIIVALAVATIGILGSKPSGTTSTLGNA